MRTFLILVVLCSLAGASAALAQSLGGMSGVGPVVSKASSGGGGGGSGSCTNGNLLLLYSDPCQLMSQMVGL